MKTIKKASPSLDWAIRRATSTWDDLMNAGKDGADSDTLKKKKGALAKAMAELQYIYSMSEDVEVEYTEQGPVLKGPSKGEKGSSRRVTVSGY